MLLLGRCDSSALGEVELGKQEWYIKRGWPWGVVLGMSEWKGM
jgi:hypothetical protein